MTIQATDGLHGARASTSTLLSSAARKWILVIQAFFIGMLVLPTSFQLQRGAVLVLLTAIAAVLAVRNWRVHRDILYLWLATTLVGVLGIIWGLVNGAPGALPVSTVYLVWPALYLLFIGLAHNLDVMRRLQSALLLGIAIATAMAMTVLVAGILGRIDVVMRLLSFQDAGFGRYDGYVELRLYNLTTVIYGAPFLFALVLAQRRALVGGYKACLWLLLALVLAVAIGSGQRGFWLIVLLSPGLALFFMQLSVLRLSTVATIRISVAVIAITVLAIAGALSIFDLEPVRIVQKFLDAFIGQERSSSIRYEQATSLWHAFGESPLIGNGLGSTVDVRRSVEQPWAYELWHLSLLESVGLVGYLIYTVAVGWIVVKGISLSRRDREFAGLFIPLATGLSCFLILTGTNPYLGKFDYLWVIFLPVALINARLTPRRQNA